MPTTFRPYQPKQKLLLPPDPREWLPEGHLAYHVSDLVDGLDLSNFTVPESGIMKTSTEGYQQCYNPQVTVGRISC